MHSEEGIQVDERKRSKMEATAEKTELACARSPEDGNEFNPSFYAVTTA